MSSSSVTMAKRQHGVCEGSLYRSVEASPGSSKSKSKSKSSKPSSTKAVLEFCRLVGARLLCYESMASCTYGHPPSASYQVVGAASGNDNNTSFRLVSNQGTFLLFSTPTHSCRDVWLGALGAGLERQLLSGNQTNEYDPNNNNKQWKKVKPRCQPINSLTYKMPNFCHSCGKVERLEFPLLLNGTPLCQYGEEERVDICPKCQMAQGVVDDCVWISELYASTLQEQEAIRLARRLLIQKINPKMVVVSDTQPVPLELKPLSHDLVSRALQGPECLQYIRVSPTLQRLSFQFQQGYMGVLELAEVLEHAIGIKDPQLAQLKTQAFRVAGDMGTALKLLHENALPPSGGGGGDEDSSGIGGPNNNSTELLQCILEFFLDLLEDGELATLGFFWPQLLNIHLQMLPATNAASLKRIELMEDFLLTVATKYSIHLAAELIWSHTADLEDSKTLPYCAKRKSSVLRFLCELESLLFDFDKGWGGGSVTVGQFLSPSNHQIQLLKLHMQDIQNYRLQQTDLWLSRSQRMDKLKTSMGKQQQQPNSNNLQSNNNNNDDDDDDDDAGGPSNNLELMAQEALRIAKNADYLSSHLAFTKRLCDIAEKLRFLPVPERPTFLQRELSKLNASGTMGGDPLNKVKTHHSRVVRIPTTEGHVFRSKERTPVLLLVEINDEGAEPDESILRNGKANAEVSEEETLVNNESAEEDNGEKTAAPDSNEAEETGAESKEFTEGVASDPKEGDEEDLGIQSIESEPTKDDSKPAVEDSKEIPDVLEVFAAKEEKGCITPEEAELPEKAGEDDEDFHSAHGSETKLDASDVVTPLQQHKPVLRSPSKDSHDGVRLSGSQEGMSDASEKSRHALWRFDEKGEASAITPSANKAVVEDLVMDVVAKQLNIPSLFDEQNTTESASNEKEPGKGDATIEQANNGNNAEQNPPERKHSQKMTNLGTGGESSNASLSKTGDTRREVLNAIMMKGMSGSHSIAAEAAPAMQRQLQDLERRRAVELLLTGDSPSADEKRSDRQELLSLATRSVSNDDLEGVTAAKPSEEEEAMEAIRLILIQYQVAQGALSLNDAAAVLAPQKLIKAMNKRRSKEGTTIYRGREFPEIDSGDIDPRLVGCGVLPPAVLQALTLYKASIITSGELLDLVAKDLEYVKTSVEMDQSVSRLNEDSAFWGRFAFGERWAEKISRIAASSPEASQPGWDLIGVIVKSNDDLRQEAFVMQLIELCKEAFQEAGLELWLLPYRILSTGRTTGIIEMVRNAMSFDALKKRPGYGRGGLREHLHRMTQFSADPGEAFKSAQKNFVRSLAAYSLLSYLFLFKDRHNGNLLLDTAGHVIHIDFGFVFGVAPGGSFSLELSTPFKLTEEMIEVMDGLRSSLFSEFVTLFCCGFLALQAHCETFVTLVEITCKGSTFKCFEGRDSAEVVEKLRERFRPDLSNEDSIAFCLDVIKESTGSYGTAQYDYFQYLSQGIAA